MTPHPLRGHRGARAARPCSAIRSPPTTSRRPARSSPTARPAIPARAQVEPEDFNCYGARRGNHEVMMRGTFANIRIKNEMVAGDRGRLHPHLPDGEVMPIYDAAMGYKEDGSAGRDRRQGIWHRLARATGRPRAPSARRPRRDRRELRAHPPLEPGRHGRASAAVPRRRDAASLASTAPRASPSPASPTSSRVRMSRSRSPAPTARRRASPPVPDRYVQRARIFPLRRHLPLRAEAARRRVSAFSLRCRGCRLGRRGPDPARLFACCRREADRPVPALPGT